MGPGHSSLYRDTLRDGLFGIRTPTAARNFLSFISVLTGRGANPAASKIHTRFSFPEFKRMGRGLEHPPLI